MADSKKRVSSFTKKEITTLFNTIIMRFKKKGLNIRFAPKQKILGRILIVIPKKFGSAPKRNLLRRRLKAAFIENKWYKENADLIINAYPESSQLSYQKIVSILYEAYKLFNKKHPHSFN